MESHPPRRPGDPRASRRSGPSPGASPVSSPVSSHGPLAAAGTEPVLVLACRPPYDWAALHGFLAARAVPGLEAAGPGFYARSIALAGAGFTACGTVTVRPAAAGSGVAAVLRLGATATGARASSDAQVAAAVTARLRRLFDLDAEPEEIGARLAADPLLARLVAARPGLRLPGAWDGFELAVRGILGQQVSVAAATRLAAKLVAAFGPPLAPEHCAPGIGRVFPGPEALVEADVARVLDMPRARGGAIRALAAAAIAEPDLLAPGQPLDAAAARLTALPGIGPWTAQYVAMRALRAADALPVGDIGLLRALDDGTGRPSPKALLARAENWRPFRAYAAMHLWAHDAERQAAPRRRAEEP